MKYVYLLRILYIIYTWREKYIYFSSWASCLASLGEYLPETRGHLSVQSAALTGTPNTVITKVTVSPTHDLPTVIQLETFPSVAPTTQHSLNVSQHFLPDPSSSSRASEGPSLPCLVSFLYK